MTTNVIEMPKQEESPARNITDNSICIVVNRRSLGRTKTVSSSQIEVETDKSMLHVQKELLDCNELKAIYSLDSRFDGFLKSRCLPSLFMQSVYLLPVSLFDEVEVAFSEHVEKRKRLVNDFCDVYDKAVVEAEKRLGVLFNSADYPPVEQVRNSFSYDRQYVQFGVSAKLATISKAIYDREQKKAEAQWKEAGEEIQKLLRASMSALVNHLMEVLTPAPDGKKKRFHKSTLNNINEFMATFDARNLANDEELKKVVEQAKLLTEGVTPDTLRSNDALRGAIQGGFADIKAKLDQMVTEAPGRSIRLDD